MKADEIHTLDWEKQGGLLPAVVQDARNHRVLMVGYMNRDALLATIETAKVTFWSRSRRRLWTKGETSGHTLEMVRLEADCDRDALLVLAHPSGPTCHLDRASCFPEAPSDFLAELDARVGERERTRPAGSYTSSLFGSGTKRIAQKVDEEGVETALAAVIGEESELLGEAADLIYHLTVLLRSRSLSLRAAVDVLKSRGHA